MMFSKLNLKAIVLILASAATAMAATSIAPLTFGDETTDEDNWNYLMKFKLWGTKGISFGNRPEFYDARLYDRTKNENDYSGYENVDPDTLGWIGTANGDLTTAQAGWFDGLIIVGGDISSTSSNKMLLVTGPIRTTGGISNAKYRGTVCQETNKSDDCTNVPEIRPNLKVPGLTGVDLSSKSDYNVSNRTVLNVSSYCPANQVCDIYFNSINFSNDSRLVVQMPEKGQPTRIFANKISFGMHPEIVVAYQGKGDLKQTEYEGNLLIYSNSDIVFKNNDGYAFTGSFVSKGKITLESNIIFAGQFIADEIYVGNEISAHYFVFKPFLGPTYYYIEDPTLSIVGNSAIKFSESNSWNQINLALNEPTETDVSFNYCFDFYSASGVQGTYAGYQDFGEADASHKFPICNESESEKVTIKAGDTKAAGIYIKPLIDGIVETDEALWLQISNLTGATLASEYVGEKGYRIHIVSYDELPTVKSALTIDVNEDEKYTFNKNEFQFQHATQSFASVIITSLPSKGSLLYEGKAVSKNQEIAVANIGKLTYQAAANDFGDKYATFKYKVVGSGTGDNTSIEYTATINVIPVNDAPTATDVSFNVSEHPEKNATVGKIKSFDDVSNEINVDTYTFKIVSGSGDADFSTYFDLASDGTITVKGQPTFDYKKKSSYTVKAIATDDAATEKTKVKGPLSSNQFTITIKIQNENDDPIIAKDQVFSIYEKQQNGKDWPSGTQVCSKYDGTTCKVYAAVEASDPDGDDLTFEVLDDVPFGFKKGTNSLIVTDGSKLDYELKTSWTFTISASDNNGGSAKASITVNILDVDEPPVVIQKDAEYSINENSTKGTAATGKLLIVFDNDKVSGDYATLTYTLSGALTGYRNSTTAKNLNEIFEVVEVGNNKGERSLEIHVKNQSLLDYEALYDSTSKKATYPVTITITDPAKNATTVDTKIAVLDVNEGPSVADATFYLLEHSGEGTQVCVEYDEDDACIKYAPLSTNDPDKFNSEYSTLSYKINPNDADGECFVIDSYGRIKTSGACEFTCTGEVCPKYNFGVSVSDKSITSNEASVTVKLTDVIESSSSSFEIISSCSYEESSSSSEIPVSSSSSMKNKSSSSHKTTSSSTVFDDSSSSFEIISSCSYEESSSSSEIPVSSSSSMKNKSSSSHKTASSSTIFEDSSSSFEIDSSSSYEESSNSSVTTKSSSSSSKIDSKSSSSSAKISSSSNKTASSSSSSEETKSSSSKTVSSSSSKTSNSEIPDFYVRMIGPFEFEIVMDESTPSLAKQYAVMDMKGQVLSVGELSNSETRIKVPTSGAYVVKLGLAYKRVNVK